MSSLPMDAPAQPQVFAQISALQLGSYLEVSASALYLFDYLLTLNDEIELIWRAKWNVVKIFYLLTRYLPFVNIAIALWFEYAPNMSLDDCLVAHRMSSVMILVGCNSAEGSLRLGALIHMQMLRLVLLTLRTWAVWNRQRYLAYAMFALFFAVAIPAWVVTGRICRAMQFVMLPIPNFRGCFQSAGGPVLLWDSALLTIYEGVMFLLMAVKAYQQFFREAPAGRSHFLNAILKDGLIYYLYTTGLSIVNIVLVQHLSPELFTLFGPVIQAILACRTITNIRAGAKNQVVVGSGGAIDDNDEGTVSTFQVDSQSHSRS